jgi:protein ImuA
MSDSSATSATLNALRQEIRRLEGFRGMTTTGTPLRFGIPDIDNALPEKSFPLGVTHEFISESLEEAAATTGFLSGLLALMTKGTGTIAWICRERNIYAPGLAAFGFDPRRILFVEARSERDALWAMEEALRCKGLAAAVGEAGDAPLTSTRRLQLAAEESGATGILLRMRPRRSGASACVTRWHIRPRPGARENNLPGVGTPRWHAELIKARGSRPMAWDIEWKNGRFRLPAQAAPAVAKQVLCA